jgi:hypothetical protein
VTVVAVCSAGFENPWDVVPVFRLICGFYIAVVPLRTYCDPEQLAVYLCP